MMLGAIIGDIVGSPYEFDRGEKSKKFPLFSNASRFTDDSVMTIAVASALMKVNANDTDKSIKAKIGDEMRYFGKLFPNAGYGYRFSQWLFNDKMDAYNSYGNGSAMRVSAISWLYDNIDDVRHVARLSAEVTHNHPEGIKGAESVASTIFLARQGKSKEDIKQYIEDEFGYDLNRSCDEIRPNYHHVESCMETVPEAITAFLEGSDFEDVIRTAISLGGDCDTIAAIAGSIAEAHYVIPEDIKRECIHRLSAELLNVITEFEIKLKKRYVDMTLTNDE